MGNFRIGLPTTSRRARQEVEAPETGPRRDGARRDNIIPQKRSRRGQHQRQRPHRCRAAQAARHAAGDHHPVAGAFHRGCAYTLCKHRERDRAVVRSGQHRVDSDQGTPTLTQPQAGSRDLILTAAPYLWAFDRLRRQSSWSAGSRATDSVSNPCQRMTGPSRAGHGVRHTQPSWTQGVRDAR